MVVDAPLMIIFSALAIAAGIAIGLLYRHMHEKEERLTSRAQNAEAELRAMITMTDDAVLVLDSIGLVRVANPAAEELFSRSEDEFAGEEMAHLIEHPLQLAELTKNGPANFDATAVRSAGETVRVEILLSQVQHTHGISYLAMIREKHAAAAALTPDFSAQICKHSHDLNNQLTGIVGHLSLILMSAQTEPSVHERIVSAKRNTLRAQETNRRLQAIARGETVEPAAPNSPAPGTIVPMPITGNGNGTQKRRILVLDDEEAICALVTSALGAQGLEVTEATTSAAAFRACEEAVKSGNRFGLVIADLSLPNDLAGSEAVLRLREIDPEIKAVVSSGYDNDPIMEDFRRHGFDAALAKPYELHKLGRVVCEILEAASSAPRKTA
jgi:PAS domain S-box-containing protein